MYQVNFDRSTWSELNVAKIKPINGYHMSSTMQKLVIIFFN